MSETTGKKVTYWEQLPDGSFIASANNPGFISNDPEVTSRFIQSLHETCHDLLKERDEARSWAKGMKRERDLWYGQAMEARKDRDKLRSKLQIADLAEMFDNSELVELRMKNERLNKLCHEMNDKIYDLRKLLYERGMLIHDEDRNGG